MALWTPAEIATDQWLDAADSSTITIATGVSEWRDKSTNTRHASQATPANQPLLRSAAMNGLDVVGFNTTAKYLNILVPQTCPTTTFIAVRTGSLQTGYRVLMGRSDPTSPYPPSYYLSGTTNTPNIFWSDFDNSFSTAYRSDHIAAYSLDVGFVRFRANGGVQESLPSASTRLTNWNSINTSLATQAGIYDVAEIITCSGIVTDDTRWKIEGYLAWKWGLEANLPAGHPYELAAPTISIGLVANCDQLYDLQSDSVKSILEQSYHLPWPIFAELIQTYGIKLAALLSQRWGDSPTIRQQLVSWYGANPTHRRSLWQPYGNPLAVRNKLLQTLADAPMLRASLAELYDVSLGLIVALDQQFGNPKLLTAKSLQQYGNPQALAAKLEQNYRDALRHLAANTQYYPIANPLLTMAEQVYIIAEQQLQAVTGQPFDLLDYNPLRQRAEQIYAVTGDGSISTHTFSVTIGDRPLSSMTAITIEAGREQYGLNGDIQLADLTEFTACALIEPVVISHAGTDYQFLLSGKSRNRSVGSAAYSLELASPAMLLDAPYALPLTAEYPAGMAADLATLIVAACTDQVTLSWQLVNWPLPKNTLYATDETPLSILRRLVGSVGGILQSLPDGSLVAAPAYPVDIDKLADNPVTAYFTDTDNIFTVQDDPDPRDGYNSYLVSDGLLGEAGHTLTETELTATTKHVDGYIVPWTEAGISLEASGGDWVTVEPLGVHTETLEEQVEIVNGQGSTEKPIYAMIDRTYRERSLGAINYAEDGSLSTEIDGESLVLVTYQTKYHRWLITDNRIEDVQCILIADEI